MLKGKKDEQLAFEKKEMPHPPLFHNETLHRYCMMLGLHAKMISKSMVPHDNRNMTFIYGS